jgi:hypothetical protein
MSFKGTRMRCAVVVGLAASVLSTSGSAFAQKGPPAKPAPVAPPTRGTDLELDPDAQKPAPEAPKEAPPLPPTDKDAWGVGGKDEEGEWAPGGKKGGKSGEAARKAAEEAEEEKKPIVLPPPGNVSLDAVVGFGGINVVTDKPEVATKVTIFSILPTISYRFGDTWTVGVRMPFSTGSTTGPLGASDTFNQFALGNIEAFVRPSFALTRHLHLPVGLALLAPTASGQYFVDPNDTGSVARAIINQAAASSRGWEENALFAPKRFGIVPSAGLSYDRGAVHLGVSTKLELMISAGANDPQQDAGLKSIGDIHDSGHNYELHSPITNWVTGLSFFYDLFDGKLTPGLRAWLAVNSAPVTDATIDYSGAQFVLEPDIMTRFPIGKVAIDGGLGGIIPVGGHLGGAAGASIAGLRAKVGLEF